MPADPMSNEPATSDAPAAPAGETLAFDQPAPDSGGLTAKPAPSLTTEIVDRERPAASAVPRTLVGQKFDDVEVLEELGRGGMGIVFKARQISLNRLVAVKLLPADQFQDPVRLARFQAEARAAASLNHPNLIQVYQVGESPFGHYFTMEYVDGDTLQAVIKNGKIRVLGVVGLMMQVAAAVHYAHGRGIVHRDLKPANIMVARSRRPVVMDFGIAKFVHNSPSLTQHGVIMGTPAYMPPEQAGDEPDNVGPHSDVYSLGAILYSLLTNRLPYEAATPLSTIIKVIGTEMPPSVRSIRPSVPKELDHLCMQCLSKKPGDRPPSAQAVADELRRIHSRLSAKKSGATLRRQASGSTIAARQPSVVLVAKETGKQIRVTQSKTSIGRASSCDIVVRATDVSKQHCRLLIEQDHVLVEDLGSANGTFVNGEEVSQAVLLDGDRLGVGEHEFQVRWEGMDDAK